ncbi:MAG: hypothetical protein HC853_10015 [Anaerolineae bacterium]|nr:hypothetical protein [Anaerolineae bacterium]
MQRQFSDEQLKVIIQRDGVMGASFDVVMVRDRRSHRPHLPLVGSARHCAIGSDLDGGFGREQSPLLRVEINFCGPLGKQLGCCRNLATSGCAEA